MDSEFILPKYTHFMFLVKGSDFDDDDAKRRPKDPATRRAIAMPTKQVFSRDVESFFKQTIDASMRDLLGEEARQASMFHLQVPDYEQRPKEFHVHLGVMFKQGAAVIEKVIVKDVYNRLDMRYDEDGKFDYEHSMKFAFEEASRRQSGRKGDG